MRKGRDTEKKMEKREIVGNWEKRENRAYNILRRNME